MAVIPPLVKDAPPCNNPKIAPLLIGKLFCSPVKFNKGANFAKIWVVHPILEHLNFVRVLLELRGVLLHLLQPLQILRRPRLDLAGITLEIERIGFDIILKLLGPLSERRRIDHRQVGARKSRISGRECDARCCAEKYASGAKSFRCLL